ncbi:hypothetical protein [Roseibium sp.]|uniref:hypothetical protein n=1 Tax=Roseibium sp. TaxID=1936156 RepID=UPI003D14C31B
MPRHLILVSAPRSGSNFHQAILQQGLGNAAVFREMFNPAAPYGLESNGKDFRKLFEEETGFEVSREKRAQLAAFFRENPLYILEVLSGICDRLGFEFLSYTLFPGHVSAEVLQSVLYGNECSCIFLTRRRLQRYVSLLKAEQLGAWRLVDTTAEQVSVDLASFLEDSEQTDGWFQAVSETAVAAGAKTRRVSYDAVLNQSPPTVQFGLQRALSGICGLPAMDLGSIKEFKQDRQKDVYKSISNAGEVRTALTEASLRGYAFDEPQVFSSDGYV